MPSLKDLKTRIASVKSTRKITSAMKMVAASKLRRAQEQVEAHRPYAIRLKSMIQTIQASMTLEQRSGDITLPRMMISTGSDQHHLLVVMTSDRGLCGAFNSAIIREVRQRIDSLHRSDKSVKLICIGRKGYNLLKSQYGHLILHTYSEIDRKQTRYMTAQSITSQLITLFEDKQFDSCTVYFNHFISIINQEVSNYQLIPITLPQSETSSKKTVPAEQRNTSRPSEILPFTFEPNEVSVLEALLPYSLAIQIYRCLLESHASEQGARMTAMDNATRNAGEMIDRLTLVYNRTRQAGITNELIEIISGAEAL